MRDEDFLADISRNEKVMQECKDRRVRLWHDALIDGWSQREVAAAAGVSQQYVGKLLRDNGIHPNRRYS